MHGNRAPHPKQRTGAGGLYAVHGIEASCGQQGYIRRKLPPDKRHVAEQAGISRMIDHAAAGKFQHKTDGNSPPFTGMKRRSHGHPHAAQFRRAAHVPACHLGGGYPLFNTMGGQLNSIIPQETPPDGESSASIYAGQGSPKTD